jgi:hypothetical protein
VRVARGGAEQRDLQVDDQLELCRLEDRQVCGLLALEDAAGVGPRLDLTSHDVGQDATPQSADLIQPDRYFPGKTDIR